MQDLLLEQSEELTDLTEFMLYAIEVRRNLDQMNNIVENDNERNVEQRIIPWLVLLDNSVEGSEIMRRTIPITINSLKNEKHEEIPCRTRIDLSL